MENKSLIYNTRDAKGKDIVKTVDLKAYQTAPMDFICPLCDKSCNGGVEIKKIVSSNFTDWQYLDDYVCQDCADLFSLYFYSYIINNGKIRLLNVREMAEEIQNPQDPPFKIVVSVSQKKHLFYKAVTNNNSQNFMANLEEEQIHCNLSSLREQFLFVGSLQALGESKARLKAGEIRHDIFQKVGYRAYIYLQKALKTRQIQIPLHLSQKPEITEEESICNLGSILRA